MLYSLLERILKRGTSFPSLENLTRLTKTSQFRQHVQVEGLGEEELLSWIQTIVIVGENERVADKETQLNNQRARVVLGRAFKDGGIMIQTLRLNFRTCLNGKVNGCQNRNLGSRNGGRWHTTRRRPETFR